MTAKWDRRFLELARHIGSWSKDPNEKVGAVAVDSKRNILATGYNGFPRGIKDLPERMNNRELKNKLVVHAEANVVAVGGQKLLNSCLYVTRHPCAICAGLIVQSGIARVVFSHKDLELSKWKESHAFGALLLEEAGVFLFRMSMPDEGEQA